MTRQRSLVAIAAVLSLLLATIACGSSAGGGGTSTNTPAAEQMDPALHDRLPEKIKTTGVINFAIQQHPPYEVVNGTEYSGPNNDLQNALAQVLGVKMQSTVVGGGLAPVLAGLLSNRYDAFGGPVEATPEREQQYDLISYLVSQVGYIVDKSKYPGNDIAQLCGKTVTYVSGSVLEGYASKLSDFCVASGKGKVTGFGLADTNATVLAVKSGRADGAGTTIDAANSVVKTDNTLSRIIQTTNAGGTKNNTCLVTAKASGLGPLLQQAMQKLVDDGTYGKILAKWGLTDSAVKAIQLNPPLEVG